MLVIFLQLVFILVLLFFLVFLTAQFYNILFRGYAPFISTQKFVIDKIVEEIVLPENATIYELGCGKAGFLSALRKKYPQARLIGVEYSFLPWLLAQTQSALARSRLDIRKKNIFKADLSGADAVYCFLNPATMAKLKDKFGRECKNGALIVSHQFPLPDTAAEKTIELNNGQARIYFYRINK